MACEPKLEGSYPLQLEGNGKWKNYFFKYDDLILNNPTIIHYWRFYPDTCGMSQSSENSVWRSEIDDAQFNRLVSAANALHYGIGGAKAAYTKQQVVEQNKTTNAKKKTTNTNTTTKPAVVKTKPVVTDEEEVDTEETTTDCGTFCKIKKIPSEQPVVFYGALAAVGALAYFKFKKGK